MPYLPVAIEHLFLLILINGYLAGFVRWKVAFKRNWANFQTFDCGFGVRGSRIDWHGFGSAGKNFILFRLFVSSNCRLNDENCVLGFYCLNIVVVIIIIVIILIVNNHFLFI